MRFQSLILLLVLATVASSCWHGPVSDSRQSGDLIVGLWESTDCASQGQSVTIRATVTNKGSRVFSVDLKDQPVLDIIIGNPDNSTIRWSTGRQLTVDLTRLELQPEQSRDIYLEWVATTSTTIWARFIDNPTDPRGPIFSHLALFVEPACPGPFGP